MIDKTISKIAIIGSSCDGFKSARIIFEKISIPKNSAIIYIPHIEALETYNLLKQKGIDIEIIENEKTILEPQKIYIGVKTKKEELIRKLGGGFSLNDYGEWNSQISLNENNQLSFQYKESLEEKEDFIDFGFKEIVKYFKNSSIGVILDGLGDSGSKGLCYLKSKGGITIAEDIGDIGKPEPYQSWRMPKEAIATGKVDYVLKPLEIKEKLEELLN